MANGASALKGLSGQALGDGIETAEQATMDQSMLNGFKNFEINAKFADLNANIQAATTRQGEAAQTEGKASDIRI